MGARRCGAEHHQPVRCSARSSLLAEQCYLYESRGRLRSTTCDASNSGNRVNRRTGDLLDFGFCELPQGDQRSL